MRKIKYFLVVLTPFFLFSCSTSNRAISNKIDTPTYGTLSERYISTLRAGGEIDEIIDSLATVDPKVLARELYNDNRRKAFWINVYNGFIQVFLSQTPELYEDRGAFFGKKQITIAGETLSFDEIEHGIIRRSKIKLSFGLLSKVNVSDYEKMFRTDEVDPRVHFALNCGAKSCPAVAAYTSDRIDEQMNTSTKIHLTATSSYDEASNEVFVTSLFSWFRGDFGGKNEIPDFLKRYEILPKAAENVKVSFNTYDWTLYLNNYIDL